MGILEKITKLFQKKSKVYNITISNTAEQVGRQEIVEYLNHNITLTAINIPSDELVAQGYRKITNVAGPILSQLPGIVGTGIAATSYKLNLPAGFSVHDLMRLNRNGELTTILKKGGQGAIQGSASLVSMGPAAVVMGVFTVLSIITSQYFLAEINGKLEDIKQRITNIDFFLRAEKRCELLSYIDFLQEIQRDYEHIIANPAHQQAVLNQIIDIKNCANRDCKFYTNLINAFWEQLSSDKAKQGQIEERLSLIDENIANLKCATMIYSVSSIMELIFSDNSGNADYIAVIKGDLETRRDEFVKTLGLCCKQYKDQIKLVQDRFFLGYALKKGKFNPDEIFKPESVEKDSKTFCNAFIDSIDQLQKIASEKNEYVVCGDELYLRTEEDE